jgi:hypothetical protein
METPTRNLDPIPIVDQIREAIRSVSLRDLRPEPYPEGNERLSADIDAMFAAHISEVRRDFTLCALGGADALSSVADPLVVPAL